MRFGYDAKDAEPVGDFEPVPKGIYSLMVDEVGESKTKAGVPMAKVTFTIIESMAYKGRKVWHNVIFWQNGEPGTGYTLHFLKCIGQPYKGAFRVDTDKWVGKKAKAYVVIDEYEGKKNNKISQLMPYDESADGFGDTSEPVKSEPAKSEEEIPF